MQSIQNKSINSSRLAQSQFIKEGIILNTGIVF